MKFGWIITSVLHGTIIVAAIFSFGAGTPLELDNVAPVEVEIVSIAPIEQVGTKKTEDLTTKLAAKQPIEKIVEKPVPKPKPKLDKPKPTPTPKDKPKVAPSTSIEKLFEDVSDPESQKPEETFINVATAPKPAKRPALPKPAPKELPKAEKKPEPEPLDDSKIAALLDKLEEKPLEEIELDFGDVESGSLDGDLLEDVEVASLSQFEFNAVKNRMAQCWSIPAGAQDAGSVVVKVGFKLNQFAEVLGTPQVLNRSSHPSFQVMAESAVRAIIECGPYDMLPPEKFEVWSEFTMEFDPRSMFDG
ncbi:MAG: hypothetical protein COC24_002840 [Alphaproteobacteria bacterium]|nr:hypothetical protein [Alphaproteobacteria bacterium]